MFWDSFKIAKFCITGYIKYICFISYILEALAPGASLAGETLPLPGLPILRDSKRLSCTGSPTQSPRSEPPPLPCSRNLGGSTSLPNHPSTRTRRGTAPLPHSPLKLPHQPILTLLTQPPPFPSCGNHNESSCACFPLAPLAPDQPWGFTTRPCVACHAVPSASRDRSLSE